MSDTKKDEQVAIFIDGQNLSRSMSEKMDNKFAQVDFDKLIPKIINGRILSKMVYFTEGNNMSAKFKKRLESFGAETMTCGKGADVPLAVNALLTVFFKKVDTIIIMSGDRDFISLLQALKLFQVKVEICGVDKHTSLDLASMAYKVHIIKDEFYIFNPNHNVGPKQIEAGHLETNDENSKQ
jgi:uncharacterized protein (TIGR00288 family)